MTQMGIGAMLGHLGGNKDSVDAYKKAENQTIKNIVVNDNELNFEFENGYKLTMFDDGQSCCEHRYMVCDDDLEYYKGSILLDAEIKDAPEQEDEYGDVHEIQFLEIKTNKGVFTIANHNEHNGYYGGFWVVCKEG